MTKGRSNLAVITPSSSKGRDALPALAGCTAAILLALFLVFLSDVTLAQRRSPRRQPRPATRPSIDYSKFSHVTEKHRQDCNNCHKVPTRNWQQTGNFPDVADYPDHD